MSNTRYTRADAEKAFENLARVLGVSTGPTHYMENGKYRQRVGTWELDHGTGGFVVYEMLEYGVTAPLGDTRRSAREFCEVAYFAMQVLRQFSGRMRDGRLLPIVRKEG